MTDLKTKLDQIEKLARRYCNSGVNPGAHLLASKILDLIEPDRKVERGEKFELPVFELEEISIEDRAANLSAEGT